jgi:tryptophan-rich sensory protein
LGSRAVRKTLITTVAICIIAATVLVAFGGLRFGYSGKSIAGLAASGAILGSIAAPEFEPKLFRYPAVWQMLFAIAGCVVLAVAAEAPAEGYFLAVVAGAVLGYIAPIWIKYIHLP